MNHDGADLLPAYAYVPGGPWPHPIRAANGHSFGIRVVTDPIPVEAWDRSPIYKRAVFLFNEGYYWEAHEFWEALWHAHGRKGTTADLLKALIKLAAAGVKVRERQPRGVSVHSRRAADLFGEVRREVGPIHLGLDLAELERIAKGIADQPPTDPEAVGSRVSIVFAFRIEPR